MFDGCSKLTTFSSDLSSLTDGSYMFYNCTNLVTFASDLSKLDNGYYMFYNCNLSLDSIECIADSLPTVDTSQNNHYIDIGTLVTASTYAPIEKPSQQINWKETMYGPAIIKMENKGWVVATNNIRI